jgi:hypothetical protein
VFRALIAAIRRFFSRRAARKLLAEKLPRGLPAPALPFRLALRVPRALEPPEGEFWTLPLGAEAVRGRPPARLFRLAALPPAPLRLDVLRVPPELPPLVAPPLAPELLAPPPPLESALRDLGVARPGHFRLDSELRLPTEVDPLRIASDAPPPARVRHVRPRTPLARAPVWRLRPRNFRLDSRTHKPANEGIVPLETRDPSYRWVPEAFRRRYLEMPWMARDRIAFLGPRPVEWFTIWWFKMLDRHPGPKDPRVIGIRKEMEWWLEAVKEQMLIRRDVKKDEEPPEQQSFTRDTIGVQISSFEAPKLPALIPEKEWFEAAEMLPPATQETGIREAYLQWRTLMEALGDR